MSDQFRRFEVLIPLRFNDGREVPDDLIVDSILELETQFGAVSCETPSIRGIWTEGSMKYRDDLIRLFVDVADRPEHREFFVQFKVLLKQRFDQLDFWVVSHLIDVI